MPRIPDDSLIVSANGEGREHLCATRGADGRYAMVYFPSAVRAATIDLSKVSGAQMRAWFYDPHTGLAQDAGLFTEKAPREFVMPLEWHDWVLVLDDASAGYGAPGVK